VAGDLGGAERALAVPCDVSEWADVKRLVAETLDAFGRIDAVFANAGVGGGRGFLTGSIEEWRAMVGTNVLGLALTVRATLPQLLEQDAGHYVIMSSAAGRRVVPGSLYSATKWAASALGEALRGELRDLRKNSTIRVTVVEPGAVQTPFFDRPLPWPPLEADDIARIVLFALEQPPNVDVSDILVRPTAQP